MKVDLLGDMAEVLRKNKFGHHIVQALVVGGAPGMTTHLTLVQGYCVLSTCEECVAGMGLDP